MKLNLNYEKMPFLPYSQRRDLPSKPGIYYVGNYDCPVKYVGLTRNLKNRHANHHRQVQFEEMKCAVIRYKTLPDEMLQEVTNLKRILTRLEKQAICNYKPSLNGTPVPGQPMSIICGTGLLIRYR